MVWPKISVIWLNYNSMRIIDIVLESLESIADLDYPSDRFELIVVDNGSSDGSFEKIKSFLEKKSGLRKKIIRLRKNLGFTGGSNIGFRARQRDSRYTMLVNNDAIVEDHSLKLYVELLENHSRIGALQGVLVDKRRRIVDSTGLYLSNMFTAHLFTKDPRDLPSDHDLLRCSFVEGTYPIYRVEALRRGLGEKIFENVLFGHGEDLLTSIRIWLSGYIVAFTPRIVGYHMRGSTWTKAESMYLGYRNYLAIINLFGGSVPYIYNLAQTVIHFRYRKLLPVLLKESKKLYARLRKEAINKDILTTSIPLIKVPRKILLRGIVTRRIIDTYVSKWVKENISKLRIV